MKPFDAVVFGAGKLACGLLGQLLTKTGYTVLFVARRPEIIDAINSRRGYSLNLAGESGHRLAIRNCGALSIREERRVAEAVAGADVVFTAVGIDNLAGVTPAIAEGLWVRGQARGAPPLNVVACENLPGTGAFLRHQVVGAAAAGKALVVEKLGGFSAGLTRRIMTGGRVEAGELTFTVDPEYDLIIDTQGLRRPFPLVRDATFTDEFPAMVMRKLFTLNCAHASAAYLGYREGCRYLHEAAARPRVAQVLRGAVAEAQAALKAELPHHAGAIDRDAEEALTRIADPRLADPVSRVARGPRRKLSTRERLVGPARLASRHQLPHENLSVAIAAALAYDAPEDPEAVALHEAIAAEGVDKILTEECGLLPHEDLARDVKRQWLSLVAGPVDGGASGPAATRATPTLEDIMQPLALDLRRRYDAELVNEVLGRVADEFQSTRVWAYATVLMKRRSAELLDEVAP